jgi:hypothetical protein
VAGPLIPQAALPPGVITKRPKRVLARPRITSIIDAAAC